MTDTGDRRSAILRGLMFTPELKRIFEGGVRLRDDPGFPGRKYFLAHAARELRRDLYKHVTAYVSDKPIAGDSENDKVPRLSSDMAQRWVREVSPLLEGFADAVVPVDPTIQVPTDLAALLDPYMHKEATVSTTLRDRMHEGYRDLAQFVPPETLEAAVIAMHRIKPDAYTHVRALDSDLPDSEVTALWDILEATLFDLLGSTSWAFRSIDVTTDMLNDYDG